MCRLRACLVTGVRRACGSGAHPVTGGFVWFSVCRVWPLGPCHGPPGWCPVGGGGGVAAGGVQGDGQFAVVDCAVVKMADQYEGWSGRWASVVPGRMWWAMQRCAGTVQPGYTQPDPSRTARAGALGFGGVPLREPDGQRLPVDGVGGDPHHVGDFGAAGGGVHVGA